MAGSGCSFVVDIGNSRVKWGEVDAAGSLVRTSALAIDCPDLGLQLWQVLQSSDCPSPIVAISSVNPPVAARLEAFFDGQCDSRSSPILHWYRSAADVSIPHRIDNPETAGADRALAVAAALSELSTGKAGLVVSCGTAITIERITREHLWQGGAIAPGFALAARALNQNTAQLPLVNAGGLTPAWGNSTRPALEAGVFWSVVGGVRELLDRQRHDLQGDPQIVWTGGDAETIAGVIAGREANVAPHLVLRGLIRVSSMARSEKKR